MTVIYKANKTFILFCCLVVSSFGHAQTDLSSYCFNQSVNLDGVINSLGPFLLPKDIISKQQSKSENCIDIILSPDRAKLFEKFLRRHYDLKEVSAEVEKSPCRLSFKTTKKKKSEETVFKIGEKNTLNQGEIKKDEVSLMEILISEGKTSELSAGEISLTMECRLIGDDKANIEFKMTTFLSTSLKTDVVLKKGEWLNIASVVKDLNDKKKTLGIPQSEKSSLEGKDTTIYELQFN